MRFSYILTRTIYLFIFAFDFGVKNDLAMIPTGSVRFTQIQLTIMSDYKKTDKRGQNTVSKTLETQQNGHKMSSDCPLKVHKITPPQK